MSSVWIIVGELQTLQNWARLTPPLEICTPGAFPDQHSIDKYLEKTPREKWDPQYLEDMPPTGFKRKRSAAWIVAAENGDIQTLENLKSEGLCNWDTADGRGGFAEHYAAGVGHLECLKFLCGIRANACPLHGELSEIDVPSSPNATCVCPPKEVTRKDERCALHWGRT